MKNLKIRTKLFLLSGFMLIGIIVMGLVSLIYMNQINQGTAIISSNWMPSIIVSEELNTLTSDFRKEEYKHIVVQDEKTMQETEAKMEEFSKEIDEMFRQYSSSLVTNSTDQQLLQQAQTAWNKYMQLHNSVMELSRQNKTDEAIEVILESFAPFDEAAGYFDQIVLFNKNGADQANSDGNSLFASAVRFVILILIVFSALSLIFDEYIIKIVNKPVRELDTAARKIADGDLNQSITYRSKDELGKLAVNFNKTVDRLRDYVKYIDEISDVLKQIAAVNLVFEIKYYYAG